MISSNFESDVVPGRGDISQKADLARWEMRFAVAAAAAVIVGWLLYVAYCGFAQHRWPGDLGAGLVLLLCAGLYSGARTRLLALNGPVKSPAQAAESMRNPVTPPSGSARAAVGGGGTDRAERHRGTP